MTVNDMLGTDVIGERGENIGEVDEMVLTNEGEPAAVVGVGGFLGIGEREVAVPLARFTMEGDRLVLDSMTQGQLENMAEFDSRATESLPRERRIDEM
jgi:sporulation protein YlmC with PRC-barrel domain